MYDELEALKTRLASIDDMKRNLAYHKIESPPEAVALEIGAGGGDFAGMLATFCKKVYATDIVNYSAGAYNNYLRQRSERHGFAMRPERVVFDQVDAQALIYRDGLFDFIVSINAFEHIPNPDKALEEAIRVLRPGGVLYLQYDPVWTSPFGHHLSRFAPEPWAHLLVDDAEFERIVKQGGGSDEEIHVFRTHMNRWSASQHKQLLEGIGTRYLSKWKVDYWDQDPARSMCADHENYRRALENGWSAFDLTARGFRLIGVKAS